MGKKSFFLFASALLFRLVLAYNNIGFPNDTACFAGWADRMFAVGPGGFYAPDMFTDYPPGFMYLLYIIGAVCSLLKVSAYSGVHLLLLKLPAILCDIVCGYLLYREAGKHCSPSKAMFLAAVYLFNPAVILNSSVWGQVDSVYTLAVVFLCFYLVKGKLFPAYIVFGIGILLKPQMLVFTPVLLAGILDYVFLQDFNAKKLFHNLMQGILVIGGMLLLCVPFGLTNVFAQYSSTLGSYPYAAVNAYNFWGLLGLNWVSQDNTFLFLSYKDWGILVIILIVIFTFVLSLRLKNNPYKYPLLGAFIILTMFVFSVRMHERYMYPGLVLLLMAYLYRPVKSLFWCYGIFSLLHFFNTAHVLFFYDAQSYDRKSPIILTISAGMVVCIIYFYYSMIHSTAKTSATAEANVTTNAELPSANNLRLQFFPTQSEKSAFTKTDFILMFAITLLYSIFALHDLGNNYAPATTYDMIQGESIVLDFDEDTKPVTLSYYLAPQHNRHFTLECKTDSTAEWQSLGNLELSTVFTWTEINLEDYIPAQNAVHSLRLTLTDSQASVLEFAFKGNDGTLILPRNAEKYLSLFDENTMCPAQSSFRDSMYFDEIYHGRTAYEFLNGLTTYETTHPPLGKIIISIGVAIFGMNPFGWRIMGALFGIAMLPFIYLFGKEITQNTPAAALACFLYAFDFMHFTQTRLATIDVFITFFVILMYYFMYQYCTLNFQEVSFRSTLFPLGACGISMGLGFACKWTGAYAGVGLAILFFATFASIPHKKKTIASCMLFFVAIPFVIYLVSYIPFVDYSPSNLWERMFHNQQYMFNYHSNLDATHPYSSSWQQWPLMVRPIWYYSNIVSDTLREGISAFGNPLVWWVGIPAFFHMIYLALKKKDRKAAFLIIGYLAQYLPWFFVTRITFIYHYFPSVAFLVLMIVHSLMQVKNHCSKKTFIILISTYAAATFGLFLLFYPVLAGQPVAIDFVDKYLRWFDSWVLVAG